MEKHLHHLINKLRKQSNEESLPSQEGSDDLLGEVKQIWDWSADYQKDKVNFDLEPNLERFQQRIRQHQQRPIRRLSRRPFLWIAASVLLLIVAAQLIGLRVNNGTPQVLALENKATEIQSLALSDGSMVQLYPGSKISYPEKFARNSTERLVLLEGEAYFDIASNPDQPFRIQTPSTEVKVLGTRFLLRSFQNEQKSLVQVEEGSVQFLDKKSGASLVLGADELGICQEGGYLVKRSSLIGQPSLQQSVYKARGEELKTIINQFEWWTEKTFTIETVAGKCTISHDFDFSDESGTLDKLQKLGFKIEALSNSHFQISGRCK